MNKNKAGITLVELMIIITIVAILLLIVPITIWTDNSFDKLLQIVQDNPAANMPWGVALLATIITAGAIVIFNIVMMFF
jgi:flagellar biosynthesis protein FlhB